MPTPTTRFANLANMKALFAGLKAKYEPKDATIVKDASYAHIDVDAALSSTSTNPVQNKAVKQALDDMQGQSAYIDDGTLVIVGDLDGLDTTGY